MTYCLDTDILIHFMRGNKEVMKKIAANLDNISTTYLNVCELFKGAEFSKAPEEEKKLIDEMMKDMIILDLSVQSAKIYANDYAKLKERGKMIEEFDILISAITKSNNYILVTRNKKHFENIENLQTEEW